MSSATDRPSGHPLAIPPRNAAAVSGGCLGEFRHQGAQTLRVVAPGVMFGDDGDGFRIRLASPLEAERRGEETAIVSGGGGDGRGENPGVVGILGLHEDAGDEGAGLLGGFGIGERPQGRFP